MKKTLEITGTSDFIRIRQRPRLPEVYCNNTFPSSK